MKFRTVGSLLIALVAATSACGSTRAGGTGKTGPAPTTTSQPAPTTTTAPPTPCGRPANTTVSHTGTNDPIRLDMAAVLGVTIEVDATRATHPRCVVASGDPAQVIRLHLGDRVEYEANWAPRSTPATEPVVSITSEPLPSGPAPFRTPHTLVTITATGRGHVTLDYTNCDATGC